MAADAAGESLGFIPLPSSGEEVDGAALARALALIGQHPENLGAIMEMPPVYNPESPTFRTDWPGVFAREGTNTGLADLYASPNLVPAVKPFPWALALAVLVALALVGAAS